MPWLDVDATALEKGTLPPVCLVTGTREGVEPRAIQLGSPRLVVLVLASLICGPPIAALLAWLGARRASVPLGRDGLEAHERGVILYRASLVASGVLWLAIMLRELVEFIPKPGLATVVGHTTPVLEAVGAVASTVLPFVVYFACVRNRVVLVDGVRPVAVQGATVRIFVPSDEAARALAG